MNRYEGKHFLFIYDTEDADFAKSVIESAENMYDKVINDFNIVPDIDLFELIICPDTESFIKGTGKTAESYQSWMVGIRALQR